MCGSNRLIREPSEDEMAERSLLMRLYHSRLAGDVYYPGEFVNGHAPELLRRGWIEEVGAGYRLTGDGVKGWAGMISPLLRGPLNPATNELRAVLGMSVRTRLPQIHKRYLQKLVEAGGRLPAETFDERKMARLRSQGYLFLIGDAWVEVTAAGRLVVEADPSPEREEICMESTGDSTMADIYCVVPGCNATRMIGPSGKSLTRCERHQREYWREQKAKSSAAPRKRRKPKVHAPVVTELPQAVEPEVAHDCTYCVYREVLEMLGEKNPKINQLVERMLMVRKIRDELEI